MRVVGAQWCDFVVWHQAEAKVIRILYNAELMDNSIEKAKEFYKVNIMK